MQIKRVKLSGFKSFVEPAELRIETGLTGVVGPNGCGKSNLLEAIRWVMGEASAKSLRGGSMDDVIFAGTASRPARDFAEVSILAEGAAANDDGDVEIVRRIERGAGSAYRINGRDVRAKDVALLFADAATGAHSPALVSQGRIGAIIAARPSERRAMLEEAAGISGLHVRRKDAEIKLRATESNLAKLDDAIAEMEARCAQLKRQARSAERYRALSSAIQIAEGRLIYARWRDAAAAADHAKAQVAQAQHAVSEASEAQAAAAAWQTQAITNLATARAAAQSARDAATAAGHDLNTLETERQTAERRLSELGAQAVRLASDRAREGDLASDAAQALDTLARDIKAIEARLALAQRQRPAIASALAAAQVLVRDADVALAECLASQARERAETRVAEAAVAAAAARRERTSSEVARLAHERSTLSPQAPLIATRDDAARARAGAIADADAARAAIADAERDRARADGDRDRAQSALAAAQASLAALEAEARALIKAIETRPKGAALIDAISVTPGYERALAAALGEDLSAAVNDQGERSWQGASARDDDPQLPAHCPPLATYVDAPAQLARRLAQVGVVVHDDGAPLAVGQRIVTRDGRLRRWDGFVSHGDGAVAAERLVRINRLASLDQMISRARDECDRLRAALATATEACAAARTTASAARSALDRAEAAARAAQRTEDQATTAIERLAAQIADADARAARADRDAEEARADHERAIAAQAALPDGSATASVVHELQAASDAARAALTAATAEDAASEAAITRDRERLSTARSDIRNWQARSGDAVRRVSDIDARAAAAAAEQTSIADVPERLAHEIAAKRESLTALTIATADTAAAERAVEAELRAHEAKLTAIGEALASAREARAGAAARAENEERRRIEMGRVSGERFQCPPPLLPERLGFAADEVAAVANESATLETLSQDRERLGPVNLLASDELAALTAQCDTAIAERAELAEAINRLRGSIGNLNREGRVRLLAAFTQVNGHFTRLFGTLFGGGNAHLALIDSDDPLEAGLEIYAQPPGKKLAALTLLSGGEQALTAIALIFGLFLTNPAPICVLDEVDAPLDDANIERFCDLLDAMARETATRYLIVTHNAVTMSRMHRLFGVTMIEQGISRLVSVDLGGAEALLAAAAE